MVAPDGGARACAPASAAVISDFEDSSGAVVIAQGNRGGSWQSYADTSSTVAATPARNAAGLIPTTAAPSDDKTPMGATCNASALHVSDTMHPMFSGLVAPFKALSGDDSKTAGKGVYDASMYDGIQFDIKTGAASQGTIYFEVLTTDTQPTPDGTASNTAVDEFNNRGYILSGTGTTPTGTSTVIPTTMTTVFVPFSLLVPRYFPAPGAMGCGTAKCVAPPFLPANTLGIQFSSYNDFSTTGAYDLWLDNIQFYTGDQGLVPPGMTMPAFKDGSSGWSCMRPTFLGGKSAAGKYLLWAYQNWQHNYVRQAGSTTTPCTTSSTQCIVMSPEVNNGSVVSEGIGYGLLISAYMGDQTLFDRFWAYWAANNAGGAANMLMTWRFNQNGQGSTGSGSATDADQDAAMALYVASKTWSSSPMNFNYASLAASTVDQIWSQDFAGGSNGNLPTFGSNAAMNGGSGITNPSYFAPAYYPYFEAIGNAASKTGFAAARTAEYAALNSIKSAGTLPPAWCSSNCSTAGGGGFANAGDYQYDAHRVPWRIGVDACWNSGNTTATSYLSGIASFFSTQAANGIDNVFDEYQLNGSVCTGCTPAAQPNSMSIVGTAGVGALAAGGSNMAFANQAWQFVLDGLNRGTPNVMSTGNSYYTYFNASVGLLTALTMTGNVYAPPM